MPRLQSSLVALLSLFSCVLAAPTNTRTGLTFCQAFSNISSTASLTNINEHEEPFVAAVKDCAKPTLGLQSSLCKDVLTLVNTTCQKNETFAIDNWIAIPDDPCDMYTKLSKPVPDSDFVNVNKVCQELCKSSVMVPVCQLAVNLYNASNKTSISTPESPADGATTKSPEVAAPPENIIDLTASEKKREMAPDPNMDIPQPEESNKETGEEEEEELTKNKKDSAPTERQSGVGAEDSMPQPPRNKTPKSGDKPNEAIAIHPKETLNLNKQKPITTTASTSTTTTTTTTELSDPVKLPAAPETDSKKTSASKPQDEVSEVPNSKAGPGKNEQGDLGADSKDDLLKKTPEKETKTEETVADISKDDLLKDTPDKETKKTEETVADNSKDDLLKKKTEETVTDDSNHDSSKPKVPVKSTSDEKPKGAPTASHETTNNELTTLTTKIDAGAPGGEGEKGEPEDVGAPPGSDESQADPNKGPFINDDEAGDGNFAEDENAEKEPPGPQEAADNPSVPDQTLLDARSDQKTSTGVFPEQEDSHFFAYFLTVIIIIILAYLVVHNKQKILGLIVEGRGSQRRRSHSYRKLDSDSSKGSQMIF